MIQATAIKTKEVYQLPDGSVAVCVDFEQFDNNVRGVTEKWWRCHRVDISRGRLTVANAYTEIIRERYSQDAIEAMQSNYNASVAGIEKNEEKEQEYLDFLAWRNSVKATVKANVTQWLAENPIVKKERKNSGTSKQ